MYLSRSYWIFSACQLKKHAYAGLPPSENHASQGKNVRTNTRNSAFPRALVLNDYSTRTPGCVTGMVNKLQWESLETRRRNDRLTMLYRIQHGLVDIHPDSYLQQSDRRTRGEHRLFEERIGSETYSYSFFPRTIRDWNMLPSENNISADTGGIQGKPYCLPPSVQLLDCQLSMYIVLTDFKLYRAVG